MCYRYKNKYRFTVIIAGETTAFSGNGEGRQESLGWADREPYFSDIPDLLSGRPGTSLKRLVGPVRSSFVCYLQVGKDSDAYRDGAWHGLIGGRFPRSKATCTINIYNVKR